MKGLNTFQSAKWLNQKLKVYQVHFLVSPFCTCQMCLYMNLMSSYMSSYTVVNKLSKFKFTVQRMPDLALTYSVGKGDFWVVLPSG